MINEKEINFNDTTYLLDIVENSNLDIDSNYEISNIKKNSLILYELNPINYREEMLWYGLLNKGDVLVLNYNNSVVLKRIISVEKNEFGYSIIVDNDIDVLYEKTLILNTNEDDIIIGKVKRKNVILGQILTTFFVLKWFISAVLLPLVLIIFFEIFYYIKKRRKIEKN